MKTYYEQRYPYTLRVRVFFPSSTWTESHGRGRIFDYSQRTDFVDEIKGLNAGHALHLARQNWPGAEITPVESD